MKAFASTKTIRRPCRDLKTRASWGRRIHFMRLVTPWSLLLQPRTKPSYLLIEFPRPTNSSQSSNRGQAPWRWRKTKWTPMESKSLADLKIPIATTPTAQFFRGRQFLCCLNRSRAQEARQIKRPINSKGKSSWPSIRRFNQKRSIWKTSCPSKN